MPDSGFLVIFSTQEQAYPCHLACMQHNKYPVAELCSGSNRRSTVSVTHVALQLWKGANNIGLAKGEHRKIGIHRP